MKGKCYYCGKEFSKAGIVRHLKSCKSVAEFIGDIEVGKKKDSYILAIADRYAPSEFWLYVRIDKKAKLNELDKFLRDIWVECCGHLSSFEIDGQTYESDPDTSEEWGEPAESMDISIGQVANVRDIIKYEYDFGSTSYVVIKVINERIFGKRDKPIEIMARNNEPIRLCDKCDKRATNFDYEEQEFLCEDCTKNVLDKEMIEEVDYFNSPRVGLCDYSGSEDDEIPYLPVKNENNENNENNVIYLDKYKRSEKKPIKKEQIQNKKIDPIEKLGNKQMQKNIESLKNEFTEQEFIKFENGLRDLMSDFGNLYNKMEDKQWRKIHKDASLKDNLNRYTKAELCIIAENLRIEKISSLKKGEMIEKINELYKEKVFFLIENLSMEDFELLNEIDHLECVKKIDDITVYDYDYLRYRGLVFTGKIGKNFIVTIPRELSALFKEKNMKKLKKTLECNDEVISLLLGMCYYYGVITISDFLKIIPKYIDFDLTKEHCEKIIDGFTSMYADIEVEGILIKNEYVDDSWKVFKEQNKRHDLEYYEFTKEELLSVNEMNFEEDCIEKTDLYKYIVKKYGMEEEEVVDVMVTTQKLIKNGERYVKIVEWFINELEVKNESEAKIIVGKMSVFSNNLRQWILKGHKPTDLNNPKK